MKLQYISDSQGVTTGVYIPISEWNELKNKYQWTEEEVTDNIPHWHKELVINRLDNYEKDPIQAIDFDSALEEIEKSL